MHMLMAKLTPVAGDKIVVRGRLASVLSYNPIDNSVAYALTYADTRSLPEVSFREYKLMDSPQDVPRVFRYSGAALQFEIQYRMAGVIHKMQVVDKSRAAARSHALRRLGMRTKDPRMGAHILVAEGKRLLAAEHGKYEYADYMLSVKLKEPQ